jgi:hypothetical protein
VSDLRNEEGATGRVLFRLAALGADPSVRLYAILDGALFPDLPGTLRKARLWAAPLVRESADADLVSAGPWIVDPNVEGIDVIDGDGEAADLSDETLARHAGALAQKAKAALDAGEESLFDPAGCAWRAADPAPQLAALFEIASGSPGIVVWCGGAGLTLDHLIQHLRGLGKIRLVRSDDPSTAEMVLFRHADSNVLAQILPALSPVQFSRLLGPAERLLFFPVAPWSERFGQASRTADLPRPPSGPLEIDAATIVAVENARAERSRLRIAAYLREAAPDRTTGMPDTALLELTRRSDAKAAELGIVTERGRGYFSYLMLLTQGKIAESPEVCAVIAHGDSRPDNQVRRLMRETAHAVREQRSKR